MTTTITMRRQDRRGWSVTINGLRTQRLTRERALQAVIAATAAAELVVGDVARITSPRPGPNDITIGDADDQGQP